MDDEDQPRRDYVRQLLLYSVLEQDDSGSWPDDVVLVPFRGAPVRIPVDPVEAASEAESAIGALHAYNAAIERGRDPRELAAPSPETCRYCEHAPRCGPFWDTIGADWAEHRVAAVAGQLEARRVAQSGGVSLEVTAVAGAFATPRVIVTPVDPEEFWGADSIEIGSAIAITGLRPHGPGYARTTAATQMSWIAKD